MSDFGKREGQICLSAPEPVSNGYTLFANCYGGEVAENAYHNMQDVLNILKRVGFPYSIEAIFMYCYVEEREKERVAGVAIAKILDEYHFKTEFCPEFDVHYRTSIPPEQIMSIMRIDCGA